MSKIESLKAKAKKDIKRIVLPEGEEPRTIEAASLIEKEKIVNVTLLGRKNEIEKIAKDRSISLGNATIIEPEKDPGLNEITAAFYEQRKHKGISEQEAREFLLKDFVYYGAMMTRLGIVDGFVAGACHTTSDVARAAIYCLKIDREIRIVSSSFVIELQDCPYGDGGLFIFGDCGIVPNPIPRQLAGIAYSSSKLMNCLFDVEPRIALLSYSSKGSAKGESIGKVIKALGILKEKWPNLKVDGELQIDAAIVPEVAKIKAPGSIVAGKANVLIFPNLDAGNIAYKLIQRLGKARVVGPLLQGLTKPASDLSRGCKVQEIVDAVIVTAIRAQNSK